MKVSLFTAHGALNSKPIFDAFADGIYVSGQDDIVFNDMNADVAVIWSILFQGRMAGNEAVWNHFRKQGKPVIVLEVGSIKRDITWKVGINGINHDAEFGNDSGPLMDDRWKDLGMEIKPWKDDGQFVTICTQRQDSYQWDGMPPTEVWIKETIENVRRVCNKDIVIRPHPRDGITRYHRVFEQFKNIYFDDPQKLEGTYDGYNFNDIVDRSWCVINHSSGPGVQAALRGTHVMVSPSSLAYPVSIHGWNLMDPPRGDQVAWANWLAHTEWTEDEIAEGKPWRRLKRYL